MRRRTSWWGRAARRRGVGLVEVVLASALLAVAATVILQMMQTNSVVIGSNRDHLYVRSHAESSNAYWESYPFDALEAMFSGEEVDPELLEELMVPLEDGQLEVRGVRPQGYGEVHRFQRLMGMGLLQTRTRWRTRHGGHRVHDLPRLVVDDSMYAPVRLPGTGAELMQQASAALDEGAGGRGAGRDRRGAGDGSASIGGAASRAGSGLGGGRGGRRGGGGVPGLASGSGAGGADGGWLGDDPASALATGEQLMEMLHDLHHAGDEAAEGQDMLARVEGFAREGMVDTAAYGLGRLGGTAGQRFATGRGRAPTLDDVLEAVESRRIPDGDYRFVRTTEDAPGEDDERLLLLYRLTHVESGEAYLLAKVVDPGGDAEVTRVEGRPVLDLGDRALREVSGGTGPVAVTGAFAHLEASQRRLYVYRGSFDEDGREVPLRPLLQIRTFADELIGDGERPVLGDELTEALDEWRDDLGLGSEVVDGRLEGVDTKVAYRW